MIILGLTGSIGMGKTTTAEMLRQLGVPVHCADDAVHELLGPGGKAVLDVAKEFPAAFNKKTNSINRALLGKAVFEDANKKLTLESIVHPLVKASQQKFIRDNISAGIKMVCLDIPLLYETGAEHSVDYVLVVSAPAFIQKQRVMARDGMTTERFNAILSSQTPDVEKRQRADFVIPTGLGKAYTRRKLEQTLAKLQGGPPLKNEGNRFPPHVL